MSIVHIYVLTNLRCLCNCLYLFYACCSLHRCLSNHFMGDISKL